VRWVVVKGRLAVLLQRWRRRHGVAAHGGKAAGRVAAGAGREAVRGRQRLGPRPAGGRRLPVLLPGPRLRREGLRRRESVLRGMRMQPGVLHAGHVLRDPMKLLRWHRRRHARVRVRRGRPAAFLRRRRRLRSSTWLHVRHVGAPRPAPAAAARRPQLGAGLLRLLLGSCCSAGFRTAALQHLQQAAAVCSGGLLPDR
jgi:hypothetical protein